jgi:sugar lactone lactonase YvrE
MRRHAIYLLIALSMLAGLGISPNARSAAHPSIPRASAMAAPPQQVGPLPRGCIRVTPPGAAEPICCVSGFVFLDGQAVAGAEVHIQSRDGELTTFTRVYSGAEAPAHYQVILSGAPLNVREGQPITITASYGGYVRSLIYVVQQGGQQVDLVLARDQADGYVFERLIRRFAEAGEFNAPRGVASDSAGEIYVVDSLNARVQVFSNAGGFQRQWGVFGRQPGQLFEPDGMAIDRNDNVYVADTGNHRIQKFGREGDWIDAWGGYGSGDAQFDTPRALAVDAGGNVYVVDTNNHRIQKFRGDGTYITQWGGLGSGDGKFNSPTGIATDGQSRIYVADRYNRRMQAFTLDGQFVAKWSHACSDGAYPDPRDASVDSGGNVYVVDGAYCVQKYTHDGQFVLQWGEYGNGDGQLRDPSHITLDTIGDLYVTDAWTSHDVQKFKPGGQFVTGWGKNVVFQPRGIALDRNDDIYVGWGHYVQKYTRDGRLLSNLSSRCSVDGRFGEAEEVAVDRDDNVYVVDGVAGCIQKFTSEGWFITKWGRQGSGDGEFSDPHDLAIGRDGSLYVADTGNHRIQKFTADGLFIRTWGSQGEAPGQFQQPHALALDQSAALTDTIHVADLENHRIQVFSVDGQLLDTWGSAGAGDGQFVYPEEITIDPDGNIFVADGFYDGGVPRVQKFRPYGNWRTSWGGYGSDIGLFNDLSGTAVDSKGRIFVADWANERIQVFRPISMTLPIATINHLSAASLGPDDTLTAYGMGQPSVKGRTVTAYRWISDRNGELGSAPVLTRTASSLSPGAHRLTLQVRDSAGQWSSAVGTDIYVARPAVAQWTMLLYLAGDYHDQGSLLNAFGAPLAALRQSFRNAEVRIAVQIDGPAANDTRRLLIEPGTATTAPQVREVDLRRDLGLDSEQPMDDPDALADFIRWGQDSFPAEYYYLAIADHGQGVQGIAWDAASDLADDHVLNDSAYLTVRELGQALGAPGVLPIAVLHLDACSMNLLEVAYEVRGRAQVLIASQYQAWAYFEYDAYLRAITATMGPRELATAIVSRYADRAEVDGYPYTIAALDLQRMDPLRAALDALTRQLIPLTKSTPDRAALQAIWRDSQKFDSNGDFKNDELDLTVDIVDWATRVRDATDDPAVQGLAASLLAELSGPEPQRFVIANRKASNALPPQYAGGLYVELGGSNGLSIFYPRRSDTAIFRSYIDTQNPPFGFTAASRWREFLIAALEPCPECPAASPPRPLPPPIARKLFLPAVQR